MGAECCKNAGAGENCGDNKFEVELDADAPPMSRAHLHCIQSDWKTVQKDVSKVGVILFLRYVLSIYSTELTL